LFIFWEQGRQKHEVRGTAIERHQGVSARGSRHELVPFELVRQARERGVLPPLRIDR
jgi:hypothetical protein